MKNILITAANSAKSYQLAYLLKTDGVIFGDSASQTFTIPKENSSSYAHELLSICLDNQISEVYPLKAKEIKALAEAKVLFKEYDIQVHVPNLLDQHKLNNINDVGFGFAADYAVVTNYQELSSKLLSLGYPDKQFVLGRLDDEGAIFLLNDAQSNFNSIWSGLTELSFLQLGKLFNNKDFEPLKIYAVEEAMTTIDFLVKNGEVSYIQQPNTQAEELINAAIGHFKLSGFFEIIISGNTVLRIKSNCI